MAVVNAVESQLLALKNTKIITSMMGNYSEYKQASKAYAKLAVKNFDTAIEISKKQKPIPPISIFSGTGMRLLKIMILDKFRIKTSEEKLFKKLSKEYLLKKRYIKQM